MQQSLKQDRLARGFTVVDKERGSSYITRVWECNRHVLASNTQVICLDCVFFFLTTWVEFIEFYSTGMLIASVVKHI